ncbi:MAG: pilus assembly protein PilM [Sarcina sp.]
MANKLEVQTTKDTVVKEKIIKEVDVKEIEKDKVTIKKKKKEKKVSKVKDIKFLVMDIGSDTIKFLEAKKKKKYIYITEAWKMQAPKEILENGDLKENDILGKTIFTELKKRRITTKSIGFTSIPSSLISQEIYISVNENMTVEEKEKNIIDELNEILDINFDDYQVQCIEMDKFQEDNINKMKIIALIYPIKEINSYLELASEIKTIPYALDITNNSLQKFFNYITKINDKEINKEKPNLLIDIGKNTFNISIIEDKKLKLMKKLEISQEMIDRTIAFKLGKTYEEAEEIKKEKCNLVKFNLDIDEKEINKIIKDEIKIWIEKLLKIIDSYNDKQIKKIEKIYIYGAGTKLNGLDKYLEEKIKIETEKIETFDGIKLAANVNISNYDQFINCIGTIIRF